MCVHAALVHTMHVKEVIIHVNYTAILVKSYEVNFAHIHLFLTILMVPKNCCVTSLTSIARNPANTKASVNFNYCYQPHNAFDQST